MTEAHFAILLKAADTKKGSDGWHTLSDGRHMSLLVAAGGASMSISRIEKLKVADGVVQARTTREEIFVVALDDVVAGSAESPKKASRKAGFVHDT